MRNKHFLLFTTTIVFISIAAFFKSKNGSYLSITPTNEPRMKGSFTCQIWKNASHIDTQKYNICLKWRRNDAFWSVEKIRHTAFKNLLNSSSLIVEVGGNTGLDTTKFIELYNCSIISFEPLIQMSKNLMGKFRSNPNIEIQPYGLGNQARTVSIEPFDRENTGTSIFRKLSSKNSTKIQSIELLDVVEVIQKIRKTRTEKGMIDMISINCEGCEFEILPALIFNNLTQYFRIIQFASHMAFLPDSSCVYCQIEQVLERTHQIKYQYTMLWEAWVLK